MGGQPSRAPQSRASTVEQKTPARTDYHFDLDVVKKTRYNRLIVRNIPFEVCLDHARASGRESGGGGCTVLGWGGWPIDLYSVSLSYMM